MAPNSSTLTLLALLLSGGVVGAIYKGTPASKGPWTVVKVAGSCSGVRINSNVVLTASHCFTSAEISKQVLVNIYTPSAIGLGSDENGRITAAHSTLDLAVVCVFSRLGIPDAEADSVTPVTGDQLHILGYGATGSLGGGGITLNEGQTRVDSVTGSDVTVSASASPAESVPCAGDSGGPAFNASGKLVGIDQQFAAGRTCGDASVYTLVTPTELSWASGFKSDCTKWETEERRKRPGL